MALEPRPSGWTSRRERLGACQPGGWSVRYGGRWAFDRCGLFEEWGGFVRG